MTMKQRSWRLIAAVDFRTSIASGWILAFVFPFLNTTGYFKARAIIK